MILYNSDGVAVLDTNVFLKKVREVQNNEITFGDSLKAYQVEIILEELINQEGEEINGC